MLLHSPSNDSPKSHLSSKRGSNSLWNIDQEWDLLEHSYSLDHQENENQCRIYENKHHNRICTNFAAASKQLAMYVLHAWKNRSWRRDRASEIRNSGGSEGSDNTFLFWHGQQLSYGHIQQKWETMHTPVNHQLVQCTGIEPTVWS